MVTEVAGPLTRVFYNLGEVLQYLGLSVESAFEVHSFLGYVVVRGTLKTGERVTGRFTLTERGNMVRFYPRYLTQERKTILAMELNQVAPLQAISDVLDEPVTKVQRYLKSFPTTTSSLKKGT